MFVSTEIRKERTRYIDRRLVHFIKANIQIVCGIALERKTMEPGEEANLETEKNQEQEQTRHKVNDSETEASDLHSSSLARGSH